MKNLLNLRQAPDVSLNRFVCSVLKQILAGVLTIGALSNFAIASVWHVDDSAFQRCIDLIAEKQGLTSTKGFVEIKCNNKSIKSIKGIDAFSNLKKLSLFKNNLKTADVSGLEHLQQLNLAGNHINKLTLKNLASLTELYVFKNNLKSLEIVNAPALIKIKANNNQLKKVNLVNAKGVSKFYLFDNKLEEIDMKSVPNLIYLDARQNPMPDEFYDLIDGIESLTALHDGNAEDWE